MKVKFGRPIMRFLYRLGGVFFAGLGLLEGAMLLIEWMRGNAIEYGLLFGIPLFLGLGVLLGYLGFTSKKGEIEVMNGNIRGQINDRTIDIPLSALKRVSQFNRTVLILKTDGKTYRIGGLVNADKLREYIQARLPLPEALRNAPDSVLLDEEKRRKQENTALGWCLAVIGLLMVVAAVLFVVGVNGEWNKAVCLTLFAVCLGAIVLFSILCGIWDRKRATLDSLRRHRIRRAIDSTLHDKPEGYEGVVAVIYQDGYTMRTIICLGDEGYTYEVECYEEDRWMSDEDYEDIEFGEESEEDLEDDDDLDDEPSSFPTYKALMDYLEEEYHFEIFPIDEIVKFE